MVEGCLDSSAINYNPNANVDNGSCLFIVYGCTNSEAENFNPEATNDDGSCVIYGCAINAWFICPGSYDPNATVNDWSLCDFTFDGCDSSTMPLPSIPDEYPTIRLSDLTDDIVDAYYYLGQDKVGCMDRKASNYLSSAILDDESCMYTLETSELNTEQIKAYPQPAKSFVIFDFSNFEKTDNYRYSIYNLIGEEVSKGYVENDKIKLNTENWNSGVYYLNIEQENKNITHRFAVK